MSNPFEWQQIEPNTLQRKLLGAEILVNATEQFQNGNFQLIVRLEYETNLLNDELERHIRAAWYKTRLILPVVGVQVISIEENDKVCLDKATFQIITQESEEKDWSLKSCFIIKDGRSVDQVADDYLDESMSSIHGKQCTLTLVTCSKSGNCGIVIRGSHVIFGLNLGQVAKTVSEQLVHQQINPSQPFKEEKLEYLYRNLPRSVVDAYHDEFNPTERDINRGRRDAEMAADRYTKNTIGIPIHKDHESRISKVHNYYFSLTPNETIKVKRALTKYRVSPFNAFYSSLCCGISERYSNGKEEGAHLVYSTGASRWFKIEGEDGNPPIPMGVVTGNAWVEGKKEAFNSNGDSLKLVNIARKLNEAQKEAITSPHIIQTLEEQGKLVIEALRNDADIIDQFVQKSQLSRPTMTSHGFLDSILKVPSSSPAKTWLRVKDWCLMSRTTDPVVCFGIQENEDRFRYFLYFDGKYFDPEETIQLANRVGNLFRSFGHLSTTISKL